MTATAIVETGLGTAHCYACAYLKGYIVGYAKRNGMRWDGDLRTEAFASGFGDSCRADRVAVTFAHIVYNRLRHGRPHLGSKSRDDEFVVEWFCDGRAWNANPLLAALAGYGLDVEEVMG